MDTSFEAPSAPTTSRIRAGKYARSSDTKVSGSTYTPALLADFVASEIKECLSESLPVTLHVLDPAVGDGELLMALLSHLPSKVRVEGFDTDVRAAQAARERLVTAYPEADIKIHVADFLDHATKRTQNSEKYDVVIANPPYVRTQNLGTRQSHELSKKFAINGRLDLYQAFLLVIKNVLSDYGTAGIIVSNRFMTTKTGVEVRAALRDELSLLRIYDLGDTKFFEAAVLPAVIIAGGARRERISPTFTQAYETADQSTSDADDLPQALKQTGNIRIKSKRVVKISHGNLNSHSDGANTWRMSSTYIEEWLSQVRKKQWGTFGDIGKIRVGIKTCADKVFIPKTWDRELELHFPLTTHHRARRFKARPSNRKVLYPHKSVNGRKQAIDITRFPHTQSYLEDHRGTLEMRNYVLEAGRCWYEIWVPQDPKAWAQNKLVFRDIAKEPTFWMDKEGTIINGDCYWLTGDEELLWLALAIANSSFIEDFYDYSFNNKLYAGRRRFITQYVEKFPLLDPYSKAGMEIIDLAKSAYSQVESPALAKIEETLDRLVRYAFGFTVEKARGQLQLQL